MPHTDWWYRKNTAKFAVKTTTMYFVQHGASDDGAASLCKQTLTRLYSESSAPCIVDKQMKVARKSCFTPHHLCAGHYVSARGMIGGGIVVDSLRQMMLYSALQDRITASSYLIFQSNQHKDTTRPTWHLEVSAGFHSHTTKRHYSCIQ